MRFVMIWWHHMWRLW